MKQYFLAKVSFMKEDSNGRLSKVTEAFLVDAVSFQDAETRIYAEMEERVRGEFVVKAITKTKIVDIFDYEDSDLYFECKVTYYVAEESGKEKKVINQMLVTAPDVRAAYDRIQQSLSNMLVAFTVPMIKESPVIEVFNYTGSETVEEEETEAVA